MSASWGEQAFYSWSWRRQGRVKTRQRPVTTPGLPPRRVCREGMFEDLVAAAVGLALVAYLLYALVRPDRF